MLCHAFRFTPVLTQYILFIYKIIFVVVFYCIQTANPRKPSVKFQCESENIYYDSQANCKDDQNPIYETEPMKNDAENPYEVDTNKHAAQNPIYEGGPIENTIYEPEQTARPTENPYEIEPINGAAQNPIYESEPMKTSNNEALNNDTYEDPWESKKMFPTIGKEDIDGGIDSLYADVIKPSKRT